MTDCVNYFTERLCVLHTESFLIMNLWGWLLSLSLSSKALSQHSGIHAILGIVLYVVSFSLGVGHVPTLLLSEIFASCICAKVVSLSLGMHWVSNFIIGIYFLSVCN